MFRQTIIQYFSILLGTLFIIAGNGLLSMYFPIYAKESISAAEIGLITTAYYAGFFFGCVKVLGLISRVGFVRAFMFVSSLIGGTALIFTMSESTWLWFPLRFLMGFGYAGFYVVIESWINSLAQSESRGRVYGTYRLVELGYELGNRSKSDYCIGGKIRSFSFFNDYIINDIKCFSFKPDSTSSTKYKQRAIFFKRKNTLAEFSLLYDRNVFNRND